MEGALRLLEAAAGHTGQTLGIGGRKVSVTMFGEQNQLSRC